MDQQFYSNGKLLLTGEYAVLDGALSLAVPTRYGQFLTVSNTRNGLLVWKSFDKDGQIWFEMAIDLDTVLKYWEALHLPPLPANEKAIAKTLLKILQEAKNLNPAFLEAETGYHIETRLDFSRDWGLGSSSTLINNIAQWAGVNAYELLWNSFAGSGYDIACAQNNLPVLYRLAHKKPLVQPICFDPPFKANLYFVHLNKKQESKAGIANYRTKIFDKTKLALEISAITEKIIASTNLQNFAALLETHEALIAQTLQVPTVKERLFADYNGTIKSLGAWGGDFILATGDDAAHYFNQKGYHTTLPYTTMVK